MLELSNVLAAEPTINGTRMRGFQIPCHEAIPSPPHAWETPCRLKGKGLAWG